MRIRSRIWRTGCWRSWLADGRRCVSMRARQTLPAFDHATPVPPHGLRAQHSSHPRGAAPPGPLPVTIAIALERIASMLLHTRPCMASFHRQRVGTASSIVPLEKMLRSCAGAAATFLMAALVQEATSSCQGVSPVGKAHLRQQRRAARCASAQLCLLARVHTLCAVLASPETTCHHTDLRDAAASWRLPI